MKSPIPNPQPASFFAPIGIGVLLQMACVGFVTVMTVIGSAPANSTIEKTEPQENNAILQPVASSPITASPEKTPQLATSDQPANDTDAVADRPMPDGGTSTTGDPAVALRNDTDHVAAAESGDSQLAAADAASAGKAEQTTATGNAAAADPAKPLEDVRARSRILKIAGEGVPNEVTLCEVRVDDPSNVQLELLDTEFPKLKIELEKQPVDGQTCKWTVRQVSAAGFDRVQPVGEFQIIEKQLSFKWHTSADKGKLPFCRLKISAESESEVCRLWSPVRIAALKFNIDAKTNETSTFVPPGVLLPPPELVCLDFTMEDCPEHVLSRNDLALDVPADATFSDADYGHDLLRIQLSLKQERGLLKFQTAWFTTVPKVSTHRGQSELTYVEQAVKRSDLEKLVKDMLASKEHWQDVVADVGRQIEKAETQRDQINDALGLNFRDDLANKKDQLDLKISDLEDRKASAEGLVTAYSGAHSAMKKLAELCRTIEEHGRLKFQLVRRLQGNENPLVISTSVNAEISDKAP